MRRQFVTHPRFQITFTLSFVLGVVLLFLLIDGTSIVSLFLLSNDPLVTETQQAILRGNAKEFLSFMIYLIFFSVLVSGLLGFYLSYKFVGPLDRLEDWLAERLEKKDSESLHLRPGDELGKILTALNEIILKKFGSRGGN